MSTALCILITSHTSLPRLSFRSTTVELTLSHHNTKKKGEKQTKIPQHWRKHHKGSATCCPQIRHFMSCQHLLVLLFRNLNIWVKHLIGNYFAISYFWNNLMTGGYHMAGKLIGRKLLMISKYWLTQKSARSPLRPRLTPDTSKSSAQLRYFSVIFFTVYFHPQRSFGTDGSHWALSLYSAYLIVNHWFKKLAEMWNVYSCSISVPRRKCLWMI